MSTGGEGLLDLGSGRAAHPLEGAALERARAIGERLRAEFAAACADVSVAARLTGPAERMAYAFDGQEGAAGELMLEHFVRELAERGLAGGPEVVPDPGWSAADVARAGEGLRANVLRMRNLLIEYNSYLSGGIPWAFGPAPAAFAERGLARYRFPADGPVRLEVDPPRLRIAFEPGPLGEVTSSGFYAPTLLAGDFRVELRYCLERWRPGDEAACLALFVHDEAALARYYAQRTSARDDGDAHHVLANFSDRPGERIPVRGASGAFRLLREGPLLSAWHRPEDGSWTLLGEVREPAVPDLLTGAKVWSQGESGGLAVVLEDWSVEGRPSDVQPPLAEERPDPRSRSTERKSLRRE